tara:strand:- start:440 stop:1363 length:924 start_codon:yes stop_codon:yes gene_type:complete
MVESEIKWTDIQIDVTDKCNAACLFCSRNQEGNVVSTDLTVEDIKKIIKSDIKSLEMCGNYGDPTANRNLFPILDVLKDNNIKVRVFTNGSAHKTSYWEELARRVGDNPVLFALDGADKRTYEYYRVNCIWEKTLENAKTFIDAGGWAVWSMVLFNWNEHQLDTAMEMADSMGFKHFHTIHSNRNTERGVGTHKIGKRFFSKVIPLCLDRKRLFLTARGNVFPCCWTASQYENTQTVPNIRDYDSLEELLQSDHWKSYWGSMQTFKDPICRKKCGQNKRDYKVITPFSDKVYEQEDILHSHSIQKLR